MIINLKSNWKFFSIYGNNKGKTIEIDSILNENKEVQVIFTTAMYIFKSYSTNYEDTLNKLFNLETRYLSNKKNTLQLDKKIYFLDQNLNTQETRGYIISLFNQLRRELSNEDTIDNIGYFILPFYARDILHDRTLFSHVNYSEYICWDDAGLSGKRKISDYQAFHGSGWHSLAERQQFSSLSDYDIGALQHDYNQHLAWISQQEEQLIYMGKKEGLNLEMPNQHQHYLRCLAEYLPPFFYERFDDWVPSIPGKQGGPKPWTNIWDLDMHTRHLLLDGWLTIWQDINDPNKYWLQPASLSMLYWVAKKIRSGYQGSPEEFLDPSKYHWNLSQNWFGGRWKAEANE